MKVIYFILFLMDQGHIEADHITKILSIYLLSLLILYRVHLLKTKYVAFGIDCNREKMDQKLMHAKIKFLAHFIFPFSSNKHTNKNGIHK